MRLDDSRLFNIYFQGRQWICFLRMQDGLISKSAWLNTRNIRRGRFAFVDIGNGRGWGKPPCTTKPTTCAQRRLGSAWASAQSDQSLRCPHEESLGPWLPFECTAKADQNPGPMGAMLKNDVHYVWWDIRISGQFKFQCNVFISWFLTLCGDFEYYFQDS